MGWRSTPITRGPRQIWDLSVMFQNVFPCRSGGKSRQVCFFLLQLPGVSPVMLLVLTHLSWGLLCLYRVWSFSFSEPKRHVLTWREIWICGSQSHRLRRNWALAPNSSRTSGLWSHVFLFLPFCLLRAAPMAYGRSQARGRIGAAAAGLLHSHSHARSKPRLGLNAAATATLDP